MLVLREFLKRSFQACGIPPPASWEHGNVPHDQRVLASPPSEQPRRVRFALEDHYPDWTEPDDLDDSSSTSVAAHDIDCRQSLNYNGPPTGKCFPSSPPTFINGKHSRDCLLHNPLSHMDLEWNLIDHPAFARIPDMNPTPVVDFDEPLLSSTIITAQIHFKDPRLWRLEQRWGPILVHTMGSNQPITLLHLMKAIYAYFQYPVTNGDVSVLATTAADRESLETSWLQRNIDTHSHEMYKAWRCMPDPAIRRVDFLHGFTQFWEFQLVSVVHQACRLVLSIR